MGGSRQGGQLPLHGRTHASVSITSKYEKTEPKHPSNHLRVLALTDADKQAVLAIFDLKVSGRATAGCRQPHIVTGVKEDMARFAYASATVTMLAALSLALAALFFCKSANPCALE